MNIEELYTVDAHDAGAEIQVRDQSGNQMDMYLTLIGIDSKLWRKLVKNRKSKMRDGLSDPDDDDVDMLAAATLGWRGFMSGDKELEFTKDNIKNLYKNAPYIAEQVDRFIANRINFIKG